MEEGGLPEWNTAGFGRRVTAHDPFGAVTQATLGNGLTDVRGYSAFTGALTSLCVGTPGSNCGIVRQDYTYNGWSNLISQSQSGGAPAASESFHYDALHRLTTATVSGHGQVTYGYDGSGNLSSKSDYGSNYQYDPVRRHAVVSVQPATGPAYTYTYDGNGNQTSYLAGTTLQRQVRYDVHNRPSWLRVGGNPAPEPQDRDTTFRYTPDGRRYLQRVASNFAWLDDFLVYPLEGMEVEGRGRNGQQFPPSCHPTTNCAPMTVLKVRQVLGDYGLRMVTVNQGIGVGVTLWQHRDRLGSPVAKTQQNGSIYRGRVGTQPEHDERHGFDAWGKPRRADWSTTTGAGPGGAGQLNSSVGPRGFTDHEHLDRYKLIHMNGRAYDPLLGRFLSVDPIIQFPANSQSLNPYSYIMNNPLAGTDPTGYCSQYSTGSRVRDQNACMATVTANMKDGSQQNLGTFNVSTRSGRAQAAAAVNGAMNTMKVTQRSVADGTETQNLGSAERNIPAVSVTGADGRAPRGIGLRKKDVTVRLSPLNEEDGYDSENDAVLAQYKAYDSEYREVSRRRKELVGAGVVTKGRHYFTTMEEVPAKFEADISFEGKAGGWSFFSHTHPSGNDFSGVDYVTPAQRNLPFFVRTPSGNILRWEPEGARQFQRSIERSGRGGTAGRVESDITDRRRWQISSICPGGRPCLD